MEEKESMEDSSEKEESEQTLSEAMAYLKELCEKNGIPLVIDSQPRDTAELWLNPPRSLVGKLHALKDKKAAA